MVLLEPYINVMQFVHMFSIKTESRSIWSIMKVITVYEYDVGFGMIIIDDYHIDGWFNIILWNSGRVSAQIGWKRLGMITCPVWATYSSYWTENFIILYTSSNNKALNDFLLIQCNI